MTASASGDAHVDDPRLDHLLDVLSRASVGDDEARVDVAPEDVTDPIGLISNAVNLLLDDLAYRQRERETALAEASRARTKDEFLAFLTHDMKTPLSLLTGSLSLLETGSSEEDLAETLPMMRRAATRLRRHVQQMLDVASLEAGSDAPFQLGGVDIHAVTGHVAELFRESATVVVDVPADLPPAYADRGRVEQALANLVGEIARYGGDQPRIQVTARPVGDRIAVEVLDPRGTVPPEDVRFAFPDGAGPETEQRPAGTGLGLYLTRTLVEAQAGTLDARTDADGSVRFTLTLPRTAPSGPALS